MTLTNAPTIQVKALGIHWRGDAILATEIRESDGSLKGVRPLGGTVEPGETTLETLHREFQEEIDQEVEVTGDAIVVENIFHHRGAPGHEIVFLYPIQFAKDALAGTDVITYAEDNGEECTARWFPIDDLDRPNGLALFPNGLKSRLALPGADEGV